jgi:hypothetical protein
MRTAHAHALAHSAGASASVTHSLTPSAPSPPSITRSLRRRLRLRGGPVAPEVVRHPELGQRRDPVLLALGQHVRPAHPTLRALAPPLGLLLHALDALFANRALLLALRLRALHEVDQRAVRQPRQRRPRVDVFLDALAILLLDVDPRGFAEDEVPDGLPEVNQVPPEM